MDTHDTATLAYAAGMVDGEGHIGINVCRQRGEGNMRHILRVTVTNTHRPLLDWLKERFGGTVIEDHKKVVGPKLRVWTWHSRSLAAYEFLRAIRPYVIVKREQVRLAIEFREKCITGARLGPQDVAIRDAYKAAIAEHNLRRPLLRAGSPNSPASSDSPE